MRSATTAKVESGMRPREAELAATVTDCLAGASGGAVDGWGCTNSSEGSLVCADWGAELWSAEDPCATPGTPDSAVPSVLLDSEVSIFSPVQPMG